MKKYRQVFLLFIFFLSLGFPCCFNNNPGSNREEQSSVAEERKVEEEKKYIYNWPNFRGPVMDGISRETEWSFSRLDDEEAVKWEKDIGFGFAGITIYGSRLFTMGLEKIPGNNKEGNDTVYCFDVETGTELWRYSYVCTIGMHPGPRTAPTINDNRVYTLSRDGDLYCFDYETGKVIWYHDIVAEYKVIIPEFGISAAPVVENNLLLVNAREYGMAFHKETGEVVWMSPEGKCGYAVIPVFNWKGKRHAAVFSDHALYILDVLTGEKICSFPWHTYSGCNVGIPIIMGNRIFISSSYDYGCALLELNEDNTFKVLWRNKIMKHHMSAGVLIDGIYYGNDGLYNRRIGSFKAIDMMTGTELWNHDEGIGSLIAAGNKLIFLTYKGKLTIAKVSAEKYWPLISKDLGRGIWFTPPTLCRGCLYIRNREGRFICIDLCSTEVEPQS
ncbi:MAG: PQQ-binding-like beta-propeller repeat protein [Spirochaetales bacterium]|nr:PQQ-binding-like beta-propeller repeat protein [Spirochaetales bacterium]